MRGCEASGDGRESLIVAITSKEKICPRISFKKSGHLIVERTFEIVKEGKIVISSAKVWGDLSKHLNWDISSKALYTLVKLNRFHQHQVLGLECVQTK